MFLAEGVELVFGFVGALEPPEDGADLVEEFFLEGVGGAEGFAHFLDEDVVGGGAFVGETGGLGAEGVFQGVLGGILFTGGSFWARRFLGVGAVGGEFAGGEFSIVFGGAGWALEGFETGFGARGRGRTFFD